jgi:ribosomal protein S18 acetylase RimI-like enzyme
MGGPQSAVRLIRADQTTVAARAELVNAAYADYFVPTHVTESQMRRMDEIYDTDLAHSAAALANGALVGMAILSRRGARGWVSSVGVAPAWRRRGLARIMMGRLIEEATALGVAALTLEVIDRNAVARTLYEALGFAVDRELLTWRRGLGADSLPAPDARLIPADAMTLLDVDPCWRNQPPCWQRDPVTLRRMGAQLQGYRLAGAGGGHAVFSDMGDRIALLDVGLDPRGDRVQVAWSLLQALAVLHRDKSVSIMNVSADDLLCRALAALGFTVTLRQLEMRRQTAA